MDDSIVRTWWEALSPRDAATLRHCKGLVEVAVHRQGLSLMRLLAWAKYRPEHAAGLAQILAHVKKNDARSIMRVCGFKRWGATRPALLSERRFERLVSIRDVEELTTALIRLVHMMDGACNVAELVTWMGFWPQEGDRDFNRTLRKIGQDYYAAGTPADDAALSN
jgi:CRISPR type I-E-associated protein CasB/Cse2